MSTQRGILIALSGGDGAGKSTQARLLVDWLQSQGREVLATREPGGSPLAESIRKLVLGDWEEGVTPETEALLMFAARSAHLNAKILPALQRNIDVVTDRFVEDSFAFQGLGRGLGMARIAELERWTLGDFKADLTILLDIDPEIGLDRARRRGGVNRFDLETNGFAGLVRKGYLARAAAAPERFAVVDANAPVEQVTASIQAAVLSRFQDHFKLAQTTLFESYYPTA